MTRTQTVMTYGFAGVTFAILDAMKKDETKSFPILNGFVVNITKKSNAKNSMFETKQVKP